jgi:nicotinate phosphoribosyltransferase
VGPATSRRGGTRHPRCRRRSARATRRRPSGNAGSIPDASPGCRPRTSRRRCLRTISALQTATTSIAAPDVQPALRVGEVVLDVDHHQGGLRVVDSWARAYEHGTEEPHRRTSFHGVHDIAEGILFTDHYQLTMAQLYYRTGIHDRSRPVRALLPLLSRLRAAPGRLLHHRRLGAAARLDGPRGSVTPNGGSAGIRSTAGAGVRRRLPGLAVAWTASRPVTLRAVPEGRVVHANAPIAVVEAPLAVAQILETSLAQPPELRHPHRHQGIASGRGGGRRQVIEFGLRRAPGLGGNAATRSSLIGGAVSSSNVGNVHVLGVDILGHPRPQHGAGVHGDRRWRAGGIPGVRRGLSGRHAAARRHHRHSRLGNPNAITVFEELRAKGHEPVGIRLDSGDLAHLSVRSAEMLDAAGFENTSIVLSSGLDELTIWQVKNQIATGGAHGTGSMPTDLIGRLVHGVGSKLVTSEGDSSLGGVYKTVAVAEGRVNGCRPSRSPTHRRRCRIPGRRTGVAGLRRAGYATADVLASPTRNSTPPKPSRSITRPCPGSPAPRSGGRSRRSNRC